MTDRDKILDKVRKLVAKAENTDSSEESQVFLAKAQEWMLRYQIDESQLRPEDRDAMGSLSVIVGPKRKLGGRDIGALWHWITKINGCRGWNSTEWDSETAKTMRIVVAAGRKKDLEWCEELFTHLTMQLEADTKRAIKHDRAEWTNARTFRTNYMAGWCNEVGGRLQQQQRDAQKRVDAERQRAEDEAWWAEHGDGASLFDLPTASPNKVTGSALVIQDRRKQANDYMENELGIRLVQDAGSKRRFDAGARKSGRDGGARADLSAGRTGRMANRGQIR